MDQKIFSGKGSAKELEHVLRSVNYRKFMLVCDSSFQFLNIKDKLEEASICSIMFDGFTSNPLYDDVCKGVDLFNEEQCNAIVAVGGGSAIDVAKCIKLFCRMDKDRNYLEQEYKDASIPLIAIPTTAGTGSESTRFAVIYYDGKKQSIAHDSILPNYAILDSSVLKTLPLYQKKCTMLDALCQGIESWWSVNSTDESKEYSRIAVETIVKYMKAYIIGNDENSAEQIMLAANYAGRAINITQTTAPHAMSYKLTSMYGLTHGHAVAICLPEVWEYMVGHIERCVDKRGKIYLAKIFEDISKTMGYSCTEEAVNGFKSMIDDLQIQSPKADNKTEDLKKLSGSVNPIRLKNNPIALDEITLWNLYGRIVE